MAWNEPDNNDRDDNRPGKKDPWGNPNSGNDQGPPDIDELLNNFLSKITGLLGGGKGGKGGNAGSTGDNFGGGVVAGILVVLGIIWAAMGVYTLQEQERGVVFRFGEVLDGVVMPGLHWNPWLVDEVIPINVTQVYTETFSNSMLTEDDNIVDVTMSIQYQVTDARNFVLNVTQPILSLQQAAESAIRHEIGSSGLEFAMTGGRQEIAQNVLVRIQSYLDLYGAGIVVSQVNTSGVEQPAPVRAAYDDVIKAGEDAVAYQNEANAYANQVIPEARGLARRVMEEANAYRDQVIARAEGEAQRFTQLLTEYQRNPDVTRNRLYIDAIQDVMSNSSKVLVDVEGGNNMMYLPLDQLMRQRQPDINGEFVNSLSQDQLRNLSNQILQDLQSRNTSTRVSRQ